MWDARDANGITGGARQSLIRMDELGKYDSGSEEEVYDGGEHNRDSPGRREKQPKRTRDYCRNLTAFWLFGLCNNYSYVIMLSAAHDILSHHATPIVPISNSSTITTLSPTSKSPGSQRFDCNPLSSGVILLADIIPTLVIKFSAPLFVHHIPYGIRIAVCVLFAAASFLMVGLFEPVWLNIIGVACASVSSGFGEITFLSLSAFYDKNVVSTWSSGTGGAGVFGALSYAGLTSAGLSSKQTVLLMLVVPLAEAVSYWCLLSRRPGNFSTAGDKQLLHIQENSDDREPLLEESGRAKPTEHMTMKEKIMLIKPLLRFMMPLMVVYIAEYFINQGLIELIYFHGIWLTHAEQYRWFQVDYQLGVFVSRSSVNIIQIKKIWILSILQFINVAIILSQIFLLYIPNIWILFALVFYEGLLGGSAYVNTFYRISIEVEQEHKEFSMGVASVADTFGVTVAGAVAVPVHNYLCSL
ncbi:battenin-like [Ptychodera flava]|uniref:battenin-like n=1 Tax=Ptychodera flava TaxID=63121 RepID=UPI00396A07C4